MVSALLALTVTGTVVWLLTVSGKLVISTVRGPFSFVVGVDEDDATAVGDGRGVGVATVVCDSTGVDCGCCPFPPGVKATALGPDAALSPC